MKVKDAEAVLLSLRAGTFRHVGNDWKLSRGRSGERYRLESLLDGRTLVEGDRQTVARWYARNMGMRSFMASGGGEWTGKDRC